MQVPLIKVEFLSLRYIKYCKTKEMQNFTFHYKNMLYKYIK